MTGHYLLDHPNPHGDHFHTRRQGPILAIVVHVTAGLEDLDSIDDHSAEKTAAYAASTDRAVSWHSGSDTDTAFDLLPDEYVAFHCKGYNTHTLGHEISKATPDWRTSSGLWVANTLDQAAKHLAPKALKHRIPLRRCTRRELDRAKQTGEPCGFAAHADLDPTRRRDPGYTATPPNGDTFPWQRFLDLVQRHTRPSLEDDMARHYRVIDAPIPDSDGRQIVGLPEFRFDDVANVAIKANDNGSPVRAIAQPFAFGEDLAVSLIGLEGRQVRAGAKVGLIVTTAKAG